MQKLEFARFSDGTVKVGYSNETEAGGFTVLGDVTEPVQRLEREIERLKERLAKAAGAAFVLKRQIEELGL
jgi:hypothetical protein